MVRFSYDIHICIGKYSTNRLRIHRSVYESSTNQVRIKGNSWQFLTIREIFSLKLGIKCHLPLLGHYFQNKNSSESCCVLALHLECEYQLFIIRRRLLRKNKER